MFRYYLTQRPPMPGAFPKPKDNKVVGLEAFDERRSVPMLHSQAWGYVEYEQPLSAKEVREYELREAGPFFIEKSTGEMLSRQLMLQRFEDVYDGNDPTNTVGWNEYFEEVM